MSQAQPSADVLAECRNMALTVAPELTAAPLYPTNLPSGYPDCGDTLAFTVTRGIDFAIRRHLIDEGRWQGPGTIIAFCQPMSRDESLGLLLHEVAHAVPYKSPSADVEPTAETQSLQRQFVANRLLHPVGDLPTMPAWYSSHGLAFVRRCLHLHFRAWRSGVEIGLPMISFAGSDYDLSPPWKYRRALGDEPQRMMLASFREIDATPAPAEFRSLFHSDIHDWFKHTEQEEPHVNAA